MDGPSPETVSLIIHHKTEPFVDDPPYADDFYNSVGRAVLMWGKLEQSLDNLLITVINIAAKHDQQFEMLTNLGRKLVLLKTIYKKCKPLHPLKKTASSLSREIQSLGDDRNMIIHSNWIGFDDGPPPSLVMRNLKHANGRITVTKVAPQISHLAQIAGASHRLRADVLALLLSTQELVDPELWKKAREQASQGDKKNPPITL